MSCRLSSLHDLDRGAVETVALVRREHVALEPVGKVVDHLPAVVVEHVIAIIGELRRDGTERREGEIVGPLRAERGEVVADPVGALVRPQLVALDEPVRPETPEY